MLTSDRVYQPCGAVARRYGRTLCATDIPSAAYIEAGSLSAGASLPTVRHVEDNGQRRNVLRTPRPFHIYFQVFLRFPSSLPLQSPQV